MRSLADDFAETDLVIVGVNSDSSRTDAQAQAAEQGLTWTNLWLGPEGTGSPVSSAWGISAWPTALLIDRQGRIRHRFVGVQEDEIRAAVQELLDEERE